MPLQRHLKVVTPLPVDEQRGAALRVAFASNDVKRVNQHFGSAQAFAIYAIDAEAAQLLEVCQFGELAEDGNEDKLSAKFQALSGCIAVYSAAVGASAVAQLKNLGVTPLKVEMNSEINTLISALQQQLAGKNPEGWLQRALRQRGSDSHRFDKMEEEGWEE